MAISAGTHIGPFEIVGHLGAGGMGEVYRAHDARLRRDVAIKVLPREFSGDPDRHRRFEQETWAVARLSHANIVAVHDVGVHDDLPYIVTELLEGETLRSRLDARPLSTRRAVEYAIQIARGLAAAHQRGIAHRDIKPENLFITKDGHLKILDFGLAKLTDPDAPGDRTATVTLGGAGLGVVFGTAAYMSPEQARGLRADHRSDIFSFGAVLYEMLACRPAFRRATTADTISAILHEEPPPLSDDIPSMLKRVVQHCLENQPEERFQNTQDVLFDLEAVSEGVEVGRPGSSRPFRNRWMLAPLGAVAILAVALVGYSFGRHGAVVEPSGGPVRMHRLTEFAGLEEFPAISPDMKSVAFTGSVSGKRQVFVRLVAGGVPLQVTKDPVDHQSPRWSPDASSLMYFSPAAPGEAQGAIWQIPALGGAPRRVLSTVGGVDVAHDGRLSCFRLSNDRMQLVVVSKDGSDAGVVYESAAKSYHLYPRWSPDSKWIAFQRGDGVRNDVYAVPSRGGDVRQLTHDNDSISGISWLPDSTAVVYASSRLDTVPYLPSFALWAAPLNGDPVRQISSAEVSYVHPDIHPSGAVVAARIRMVFDIWKFPVNGSPLENVARAQRITHQTGHVQTPTVAPDDKEIAFLSDAGGHANLWVMSTETGELRELTHEDDPAVALGVPIWSPDGDSIAFVSSRGNTGFGFGLWVVSPDGSDLRRVASRGLGPAWSADSRWLYYADAGTLKKVPSSGGPSVVVRTPTRNVIGSDGSRLYFMIERALIDGRPEFEIQVASPDNAPATVLQRISASRVPSWQIINPSLSPDGKSLAVPLTDGLTTNIWAVSTADGHWRQLTDFGERPIFIARRVSWTADGRSILAAVGDGDSDVVLLEGLVRGVTRSR
jgi:Tol biopolymer transport system component